MIEEMYADKRCSFTSLGKGGHYTEARKRYATDTYHREHIYVDYSSRMRTRTITPGYRCTLCYNRGPWHTFRYCCPYYRREYVFVSLGGYWPFNYRYIRYYWRGYYPIVREVVGVLAVNYRREDENPRRALDS
jgi:hypothetical protein